MREHNHRAGLVRHILCTLLGCHVALAGMLTDGLAQDAAPPRYLGANDCRSCHALTHDSPHRHSAWVEQDEYLIWQARDRHSRAFDSLLPTGDPTAAIDQMQERLEIEAAEDQRCLACHAPLSQVSSLATDPTLMKQHGVSCEACHGPSEHWSTPHRFIDWRARSRDEKAGFGMWDLRDPLTKAQVCTSCHVGDAAAGRFVTHEMYAAGHPPLQGIEIVGYAKSMPPHWTSLGDKAAELTRTLPTYDTDELVDAKAALLGNAVAFQQLMKLIAQDAEKTVQEGDANVTLPGREFALYDCRACHHALERSDTSWRQHSAHVSRIPGRPRAPMWAYALLQVASQVVPGERAGANETVIDLVAAHLTQPFGSPQQLQLAASHADRWCEELIAELDLVHWSATAGDADRILESISRVANQQVIAFDTARQLGWALDTLPWTPNADSTLDPDAVSESWDQMLGLYRPENAGPEFRLRDHAIEAERVYWPAEFHRAIEVRIRSQRP